MKIFWVEDFGDQPSARVSLTLSYLGPILSGHCRETLARREGVANGNPIEFMRILAENADPIVWADGLISGICALRHGTSAFQHDLIDIPDLSFPFDVAILDLILPSEWNAGTLAEFYTNETEREARHISQVTPNLDSVDNYAGIVLAIELLKMGMPANRIFFLSANADSAVKRVRTLLGSMLQDQLVVKDPQNIKTLCDKVQGETYYRIRDLVAQSSKYIKAMLPDGTIQPFPFLQEDASSGFFLFDKERILTIYDELNTVFSIHLRSAEEEQFRYRFATDLLFKEFDALNPEKLWL